MKNIKKYVALILAVAFIAILPLTAFAGSSDYLLPGTWELSMIYDTKTSDMQFSNGGISKIIMNAGGTATYYIGPDAYSARWTYDEPSSSGGDYYTLTVNYNGSNLPLTMLYSDSLIYLVLGDNVYIYSK